jgi:xanthine dehydrogenase accessory factor
VSETQDVLRAIEERAARGERMALATIVAVKGSTYRREGARLLIPEHGPSVGTISGGCLEGDVRTSGLEVMADGTPRLLHFDLTADDEAVWGWGLGCNGTIDVFVEPADGAVRSAGAISKAIDDGRTLASVTVVESNAEEATHPGAHMLFDPDGVAEGSLGDTSLDELSAQEAARALRIERSGLVSLGDGVRAFVEVIVPPIRLLVCGAGHDVAPLVAFAAGLGWRVEVADDRPELLNDRRFPGASAFVLTDPAEAASHAAVDDRTYVVVMSHNFLRDTSYLRSLLGSPAPYIGMLGPGARLERLLDELRRGGFEPDPRDLAAVHGPAGLDLGGDGPEEVAWAIIGEVMAVRNGRRGGPLRERVGPIHGATPAEAGAPSKPAVRAAPQDR